MSDAAGTAATADAGIAPLVTGDIEGKSLGDRIYRGVTTVFAAAVPVLLVLITLEVLIAAWPAVVPDLLVHLASRLPKPARCSEGPEAHRLLEVDVR